ncbi:MAG TPA: hypothetical protein VMD79_12040 [Solirubrobacteraceae bacterium]|nr:hypothetical protein [Solirubrobacteraceae bacterium]
MLAGVLAAALVLAIVALVLVLAGAGTGEPSGVHASAQTSVPAYVTQAPTHEQKLIERGAHLIVTDGCTACHLGARTAGSAPNFESFAGHRLTLRDGRSVLVDEAFIRAGLVEPVANELAAYRAAPMLAALAHLHLAAHPAQVAALAAFIEQVGPETE